MPGSTEHTRKSLSETLPSWILAGTGIIYAAGFLVVLAFLDRYGIREAGSEFWKARYIHIGILCLSFPLILNGTVLSLLHLVFHGKFDKPTMWQRIAPIGALVINLEIVCFILILLTNKTPSGNIAGLHPLLWILGTTLLGVAAVLVVDRVIERAVGTVPNDKSELSPFAESFTVTARWILVVIVGCLDVWFFLEFKDAIAHIQPALALSYFGMCVLLGVIVANIALYVQRQAEEGRRRAVAVFSSAIVGPFLYIVVLSFSYGIFQNIPATRGGGDYTGSPRVTVTLKEVPLLSARDTRYFDRQALKATIPLVLIEETTWAFYLADPSEAGGPSEWKQIGGRKPAILVLNKAEVVKLVTESRNTSQ